MGTTGLLLIFADSLSLFISLEKLKIQRNKSK